MGEFTEFRFGGGFGESDYRDAMTSLVDWQSTQFDIADTRRAAHDMALRREHLPDQEFQVVYDGFARYGIPGY